MNANEGLRIWATKKLDGRLEITENDFVSVEEKEFSDGYCETCYNEWTGLAIVVNGETIREVYESFSEIMEQVLEIIRKTENPDALEGGE